MKTKYVATFSNGSSISRNSTCEYTHAYAVTVDGGAVVIHSGFCGSLDKAQRAATVASSTGKYGAFVDGKFVEHATRGVQFEIVTVSRN